MEKEYIIFCDESEKDGKFYSNFYGGVLVGSSQYERITRELNNRKRELNLFGEIKWEKVTERYLPKYQEMVSAFFSEIGAGKLKVRLMFRHNAQHPQSLTVEDVEHGYYKLYYQFLKHSFGLDSVDCTDGPARLRIYLDQFPDTVHKSAAFKKYLRRLQFQTPFRTKIIIDSHDVAEVRSHEHVLLQCLDIVLGSMAFRLNDRHKAKIAATGRRGKRTIAKEKLFRFILQEIRRLYPNFNVGITTGGGGISKNRWQQPYRHWSFASRSATFDNKRTKRGSK